jgi:Predicted Rossmann fold nucleotide-binding protein involved in DNA uptake
MASTLQMTGNVSLLNRPDKVAFLSSRRISAADVLKCYEWAEKVRDGDRCIVSGFQSPLEKDVLKFLLRGKVPIILVLARSLWKTVPEELREAVNSGRLLIVSPVKVFRASAASAEARNRWILANCSSLVLGALDPAGRLAKLAVSYPAVRTTRLDM